jgi:hypothetical protein
MEHTRLTSYEPLHLEKIDDMVQYDGIGIVEGEWIDSLGRQLKYSPDIIKKCVKTLLGKPVAWPHTDNKDDMRKVRGVVTETWEGKLDGKTACFYRALIHDSKCGLKILNGELPSSSIEADFAADGNHTIIDIDVSAITPTNNPACSLAKNIGTARKQNVIKLEGKEKMTDNSETPVLDQKALLEMKKQLDAMFPVPKSKNWADMTNDEKYGASQLFFKANGYPLPQSYPTKEIDPITGQEHRVWPDKWPEELKNETLALETKVKELTQMNANLQTEVTKRDNDEIKRLHNAIKEVDTEFDINSITKMENAPARQKLMMQSYLDNVTRLKPKVGPITAPADETRMEKMILETFGTTISALEAEMKAK